MNKKKAAILITGLTRTYKKTRESFFSKVIAPNTSEYDIDIYLCFWEKTHTKGQRKNENITQLSSREKDDIIFSYKPKSYKILNNYNEANNLFRERSKWFTSVIGEPKNSGSKLLHQNAVMAQSYTWHIAFSLVREKYDLLVKTRFDSSYNDFLRLRSPKKNNIYCFSFDHQLPGKNFSHFGDALFFGNQSVMKVASLDYHVDMFNLNPPPMSKGSKLWPEDILHDYLKHHNIKINLTKNRIKLVR